MSESSDTVKKAITRATDEVRRLAIDVELFDACPTMCDDVIILMSLVLLRDRLSVYKQSESLGRPTYAPPTIVKVR